MLTTAPVADSMTAIVPLAAKTDIPAETPCRVEECGIRDGPNESRKAAVSSGAAAEPEIGLAHWDALLTATAIVTPLVAAFRPFRIPMANSQNR